MIARGERPSAWIFDFDQAQVSPGFYAGLTERWATPPEERAEPKHEKPLQAMDYASPETRELGFRQIDQVIGGMTGVAKERAEGLLKQVKSGQRDVYC